MAEIPDPSLHYESLRRSVPREAVARCQTYTIVAGAAIITINLLLACGGASFADGFRAMGFAFVIIPLANLVMLVGLLLGVPLVRRRCPGASLTAYVIVSVVGPVMSSACSLFLTAWLRQIIRA